jgi:hypothetical protein
VEPFRSGSSFGKVLVPVLAPFPFPVPAPVPTPDPDFSAQFFNNNNFLLNFAFSMLDAAFSQKVGF